MSPPSNQSLLFLLSSVANIITPIFMPRKLKQMFQVKWPKAPRHRIQTQNEPELFTPGCLSCYWLISDTLIFVAKVTPQLAQQGGAGWRSFLALTCPQWQPKGPVLCNMLCMVPWGHTKFSGPFIVDPSPSGGTASDYSSFERGYHSYPLSWPLLMVKDIAENKRPTTFLFLKLRIN